VLSSLTVESFRTVFFFESGRLASLRLEAEFTRSTSSASSGISCSLGEESDSASQLVLTGRSLRALITDSAKRHGRFALESVLRDWGLNIG
jgi:hypothetical protein